MFGCLGIALAMYASTPKENKKKVLALVLPAGLTAVFAGITEPLEFTFLFIAPYLFLIHALLGATMVTIMYLFGVVGIQGGGAIEIAAINWIPLFSSHGNTYIAQFIIGIIFVVIYFFVFKFIIEKFNVPLPGRVPEDGDAKLYTKEDYKAKQGNGDNVPSDASEYDTKAIYYLEGLGGKDNIKDVTNCATRLRVTVNDPSLVKDNDYFTHNQMAHGVAKSGTNVQVIVGLSVPQIRDSFETMI